LNPAVNSYNEVGPPYHYTGQSVEYEYDTSLTFYPFGRISIEARNDWVEGPPMKIRWTFGATDGMHCDPIQRLGINGPTASNRVFCKASARYPFIEFAPKIDWEVTLTMKWGERKIVVTATGCRDGFPSYQAHINGQKVFHLHDDGNAMSLFPPCEYSINETVEISG